jgi:6-phosphofructokinase 1
VFPRYAAACVAAPAQDLLEDTAAHGTDASGNPILADIGMWLRSELKGHFKDADIKYIDPSYIIRCVLAVRSGAGGVCLCRQG